MTISAGHNGEVSVDGTVVAEVRGYTLDTGADTDDTTPCGQDWQRMSGTLKTVNGTVEATSDPADPGQIALVAGTTVTLVLRQQGVGSGLLEETITGTLITGASTSLARDNYPVTTFAFEGGQYASATQA